MGLFGRKKAKPSSQQTQRSVTPEPTAGPKDDVVAVDWIEKNADSFENKLALHDLASGRTYTYGQLNDRVGRVADALLKLGVQPGDRVGFLAMNSTDIMEMIFGCWRIGAVSLALNFRLTAPELEFIINDAAPKVIFHDNVFSDVVAELQTTTSVSHWINTDGVGGESAYETHLAGAQPLLRKTHTQSISDQCMLMYSSGTTGRPKGVIITHKMMLFSAMNAMRFVNLNSKSVNFAVMPLFHIGGLNVFTCPALYCGGSAVIQRTFEPGEALRVFNSPDHGITHFLGVPAIYNALKAHPDNPTTDFSRLEAALAGAEAVPNALVQWWSERGLTIQEGYGMTESAASNCMVAKTDALTMVGSAGKALMHCELKVMKEDGTQAAPGELGELWMRGPVITPGYWNRPEANAESFVDGWFRSGDIARIDANNYVYIEDRLKDMYISGGENVYPAEVENTLYEMPQIAEVAVIGLPDEKWGEVGCACVVLKEGQSLTQDELLAHCAERLAKYKRPVSMVLMEALPRNATGKVLKFELRKSVPDLLESH